MRACVNALEGGEGPPRGVGRSKMARSHCDARIRGRKMKKSFSLGCVKKLHELNLKIVCYNLLPDLIFSSVLTLCL